MSDEQNRLLLLQDLMSLPAVSGSLASVNLTGLQGDSLRVQSVNPANLTDATCANDPNCYYSIDWNTQQKYLFIYHLFSLLWIYQFIVGFG